MSPKKLTNEDKTEILKLYRETPATTSTLAEQFGVSSSTISRYLKNSLSETEYEDLIQQKRLARTTKSSRTEDEPQFVPRQATLDFHLIPSVKKAAQEAPVVTDKDQEMTDEDREIEAKEEKVEPKKEEKIEPKEEELKEQKIQEIQEEKAEERPRPILRKKAESSPETSKMEEEDEDFDEEDDDDIDMASVGEMFGEDIADDDEDLEEDWEDEEDSEEDYDESFPKKAAELQILPISDATFPSTCYLVIDRTSELITCPLREFTHLGNIPQEEVSQRTLPIFDNHRVARRFSKRSQRVIKVPDGTIFQKTYPYLADKGITRLLLDGQIYALS